MAFAGLDVGTSGSKLMVYDLDARVLYKASASYKESGSDGLRELHPETVLASVVGVLRDAGKNCPAKIEALAVASLGESVICLGPDGASLADSMLTGDSRGIPETQEIIEAFGAQRIFEITGTPPNELYGLPKYLWLSRNTNAIKDAEAILFYEDYIGYYLTGERKVSYSSAARSMAFDIRRKCWSEELLAAAGIRVSQMSEPVPPCSVIGTILPGIAAQLGLDPDMKIVVGGHDQTCAALGGGLRNMGTAECGLGTCEFMFLMLPHPVMTPYMIENDFTCIPYVKPDTYLTSLEVPTCGILKNWARDTIFSGIRMESEAMGRDFYSYMDKKAASVRTDVMVLPQFGSAGNPDLSMDACGTITGLTIHTKPEEIYRAILEGMAFQLYLAYERLEPLGVRMETLAMTGGGAASGLTLQIRADIFNRPVIALESSESGTLGCMIMAAAAVGAYASLEEGVRKAVRAKKTYLPDPAMHAYYETKFARYKELYEKMHLF